MGAALLAIATSAVPAAAQPGQGGDDQVPIEPTLPFPQPPAIPEFDPAFYDPPLESYADLAPGEIIAARQVNVATLSVVPLNVDAWNLSYRSTNSYGEPIAAVTTVLQPRSQAAEPRPLLSFQMGEDSLAQYCSPSYALQLASIPGLLTGSAAVSAEFLEAQAALAQGWVVSIPDHQGPNSAYAAGPLGARITLDGVRAAQRFDPLQLDGVDTRVGLWGYSGGAIVTGHAAEILDSYAPELNVVGVAEGGVPADLGVMLNNANGQLASGLILAAVFGLAREYPDFRQFLESHLNPLGQAVWQAKNPLCVAYTSALIPFGDNKGMIELPGDPLNDPVVKSVIDRTRMGSVTPSVPMYIYQSNPDWIVPVGQVNTLVDTYCQDPDARVQYTRDHFSEHLSLPLIAAPSALLWLRDRFDGVPVEPGCSTFDAGSMALDQSTWPEFADTVGDLLAAQFGAPLGA